MASYEEKCQCGHTRREHGYFMGETNSICTVCPYGKYGACYEFRALDDAPLAPTETTTSDRRAG